MKQLIEDLKSKGVQFCLNEEVVDFELNQGKITLVITDKNQYTADTVVLATGSWSRELVQKLGIKMPLMPGRGYSVTLEVGHPIINFL